MGFSCSVFVNLFLSFIEKQGSKAIRLKYAENVRFVALSKQATIGKWEPSYTENVGLLDVVGNDRKYDKNHSRTKGFPLYFRQAWSALGDMPKEQAKEQFIRLLLEICPMFGHHVEAHHVEDEEKIRLK